MKTISIFLIACFAALSICAQNMVTITVKGTSINKILVDNRYYSVIKDVNNQTTNAPIIITDLLPGQHSLKLLGTNAIENTSTNNTTFNLRSGYDLQIGITNNGSIQLKETLQIDDNDNQSKTPITDARFNILYKNIKAQKASGTRVTSINKTFTNSGNYFSTIQARKLLQLVPSQISRLDLAKTAYSIITDPENFTKIYDLLYSKTHRDDLTAYVENYMNRNHDDSDHVAMDDASFNTVYQDVQQQWPASSRLSYMINLFADESNHFTVLQARQLIELVNSESERLQLAKASYRNITDPANFTRMYEILSSQSSRNELAAYVSSSTGNTNNNNGTTGGMSDVNFNKIYQATVQQSTTTGRVNYLSNTFINANNYFSVVQARQLIQQVSGESYRLDLAKKSYRTIVDRENFTRIYDILNVLASRNELAVYVNNYNNGNTGVKTALTATQFDALYRDIQNRSNSYRMTGLTDFFATATNYVSVAQVQQLIELITTESDRLQLAKSSYDNVVDPTNFSQLYNLLATQASRNELMAYVNNYNGGEPTNNVRVPMTDANFNSLYRNIQFRFGIGAKMSSLTEVFANSNNYFTVAQAKQLIQLVSDESNRLQLAKSAYRNITNPENFNEMYEIFSNQAIKDELAAYVNANK